MKTEEFNTWFWGKINPDTLDWLPQEKTNRFFQCVICGKINKAGNNTTINNTIIRGRGGGLAHSDCLPATVF